MISRGERRRQGQKTPATHLYSHSRERLVEVSTQLRKMFVSGVLADNSHVIERLSGNPDGANESVDSEFGVRLISDRVPVVASSEGIDLLGADIRDGNFMVAVSVTMSVTESSAGTG